MLVYRLRRWPDIDPTLGQYKCDRDDKMNKYSFQRNSISRPIVILPTSFTIDHKRGID